MFQVFEPTRSSTPCQIVGRCCNYHALTGEATSYQTTGAFKLAEANDEVDAFFYWVNQMVRESHRELQVRMLSSDVQQDWNKYPSTKGCRHVNPQATCRPLEARTKRSLGCGDFVERRGAGCEICFAIRREGDASGGAMEKLRAEAVFQFCDRLPNCRLGEPELFGCVGETAGLCGGDKNRDSAECVDLRHFLPH